MFSRAPTCVCALAGQGSHTVNISNVKITFFAVFHFIMYCTVPPTVVKLLITGQWLNRLLYSLLTIWQIQSILALNIFWDLEKTTLRKQFVSGTTSNRHKLEKNHVSGNRAS